MIQINPLQSYIDGGARAAITSPPSASLVFDLPGRAIWVKGVKLKGTDHTYTFSHDTYISITNTPGSNESEDIKIGINTTLLKLAIDTTYGVVSASVDGLAPKFSNANKATASAATTYNFLGIAGSTLKWYQLPWRNVRINTESTDVLGVNSTDPLIISSGDGIEVTWDSTNKRIVITNSKPHVFDNTDFQVSQIITSTNNDYRVLLKRNANNDDETGTIRYASTLLYNPSTKILKVNGNRVVTFADLYVGATSSAAGTEGLVPAASSANRNKFLRGDGTWQVPTNDNTWRPVKVEGTQKLASTNTDALDFHGDTGIEITYDATSKKINIKNTAPDVNHNTDRTGVKLGAVSGSKKTDSTVIINNSATGLTFQGGTNLFKIGDGTNYIEVPVTPSFTVTDKSANILTSLTTIATIAGTDIKAKITVEDKAATIGTSATTIATIGGTSITAKIGSYAASSHTHTVKINDSEKIIAAPGGTAVDLGSYLPLSGGWMDDSAQVLWKGINGSTSVYTRMGYYSYGSTDMPTYAKDAHNNTKAFYIMSNGYDSGNDWGGLSIDDEGVSIFGAGDPANNFTGVFRVFNEDSFDSGPQFIVTKGSGAITKLSHTALNFISNVATGTQPYACSSTTLNNNLNADLLDDKHATQFLEWEAMKSGWDSAPFQEAVDYFKNLSNLNNGAKILYSYYGGEYTMLFTRRNDAAAHGTILKWGYPDNYLRIIRLISGNPKSTDWEKIAAGNADIWTTSRTLTIGSTGKSVNGSADVSWSLAEIGAAASNHTHTLSIAADSGTSSIALAASTKYKLTAGGSTYVFTSTPDENVKQIKKTDNVNRPLMMINGTTSAGDLTSTSMFSTGIYANASTNVITATGFTGKLVNIPGGSYSWYNFQQYNSSDANPSYYDSTCAIININSYSGWQPWIRGVDSEKGSWCIGQYTTNFHIAYIAKTNTTNTTTKRWDFGKDGILTSPGGFVKTGYDDTSVLLAGGGAKALSDFAMSDAYVKKAGDTMTGSLGFSNSVNRSKRMIYETDRNCGIKYDYAGNEALIISSGRYGPSAVKIYVSNGITLDDSDGQYTTGTPALDLKYNCAAINYNWGTSTPGYTLYVNGTSCFTEQITSTLATGTSPFNVTSTTLNTNLNADLLDDKHADYFKSRLVGGVTGKQPGWYYILDCTTSSMAFLITFYGNYNYLPPSPTTFMVSHSYNTTAITQIGKTGYTGWITKLAVVHYDTYKFKVYVYFNNTTYASNNNASNEISFEVTPLDPNARSNINLGDYSVSSITPTVSCNAGIFAAEYADSAGSATKLATARNLKVDLASASVQSFDGTADATSIGVAGTLPFANLPTMYWANVQVKSGTDTETTPLFGRVGIGAAVKTGGDGLLNFPRDNVAINFRLDSGCYSKIEYMSLGNEALVFANQYATSSFIFKTNYNLGNTNDWRETNIGTPAVLIKSQSLYINCAIGNGVTPGYNFYVGGTGRISGDTYINPGLLYITKVYDNVEKTITIGAANSSWYHFNASDPSPFYFSNNSSFNGTVYPYSNNSFDLGTASNRWRNLLVSGYIDFNGHGYLRSGNASSFNYGYTFKDDSANILGDSSNSMGMFSGPGGEEGAIIVSPDTCIIYNSSDTGWNFAVHDKDLGGNLIENIYSSDNSFPNEWGSKTRTFGIRQTSYVVYSRGGFQKKGSSDSYVLLGGGGHKLISDFATSGHNHGVSKTIWGQTYVDANGNLASIASTLDAYVNVIRDAGGAYNYASDGSGNLSIGTTAFAHTISLRSTTSGTELYLNSSGNVGIGTASPGYKLDVNGTLNATRILVNSATYGSDSLTVGGCIRITGGSGGGHAAGLRRAYFGDGNNCCLGEGTDASDSDWMFIRGYHKILLECNSGSTTIDVSGYPNSPGFKKNGSSDSYVLLGGGGHKLISDFATSGHTHSLSIAATSDASSISLAANTKYKLTAGGQTYVFTTPVDTNTWRGITDIYYAASPSSDTSLSQKGSSDMFDLLTKSGGRWSWGGNGNNQYCLIAEIDTSGGYINYPIIFELNGRSLDYTKLSVLFVNLSSADPALSYFHTDNVTSFYLYKSATSKWRLYGSAPDGVWAIINLVRVIGSRASSVTVKMESAASLPTGYTLPTYGWNVNYANSAGSVSWSNVTGKPLSATSGNNGPTWGNFVPVKSDGVMEIGKYLDFHNSSNDGVDYAVRLQCQGNNQVIINLPTSAGTLALTSLIPSKSSWNYDDRYVRAYGTDNNNIDTDWGQSFKTFDPIPSGTPPELNPNISLLSIGNNFARRKELAFTWNNDNIYYRRRVDSSFSSWVKLIHSGNYTDYTVTKTGSGASGTWGINVTGNAATASKIVTAGGSYSWYNILLYNSSNANPSYFNSRCAIINVTSYTGWQPWIRAVDNENGSWALGLYQNFVTLIRYNKSNTGNGQGNYNWTFGSTGNLSMTGSCYAAHYYENSDARLKHDIIPISKSIKQFKFHNDERIYYGFIALELEILHPELVDSSQEYKKVNYDSAICYYIAELENRILKLEDKLKKYEEV